MADLASVATFGLRFVAKDQVSAVLDKLATRFSLINKITGQGFREVNAKIKEGGLAGKLALGTAPLVASQMMQGLARAAMVLKGALSSVIDKAAEFQTNMQTFSVIAGKSGDNLTELKKKIIAFTTPLPTTANEVAKASVEFARMGFAAILTTDQMIQLGFEAIKFGRAIGSTDAQAALFLGKLATWLAIANPTAEKMNEIASVATRLGWSIKGTTQDIIKATERFGAFVRAMGASESETLALAAFMVDSGIQIRRGSTAINRTFQLMAVNINAFGSSLAKIKAIESAKEFEKMFRAAPVKAFQVLLRGLNAQGGVEAATLLKTAGLHGNYISDLIAMSRNVEKLTGLTAANTDELEKSGTAQSAVNKAYAAGLDTYKMSMKILEGSLENIQIIMGGPLLAPLMQIAKSFVDIVATSMEWFPGVTTRLFQIFGFLLLLAVGGLIAIKTFVQFQMTFAVLEAAGLKTFAAWSAALVKFIAIVIIAIAAITLIVWLWKAATGGFQSYAETLKEVTGKIGDAGSTVLTGVTGGLNMSGGAAGSGALSGATLDAIRQGTAGNPPQRQLTITDHGESLHDDGDSSFPQLAAGGIVVRPTPVVVGEAGAEAIIPLKELASMLGNFATSKQASPAEMRVTVTSPIYLDGMEIGRTIRESVAMESLRQGRLS